MTIVAAENADPMVSTQISTAVSDGMDAFCRRHGRIKRQTISRIVEWFLEQPQKVQRVVLGVEDGMDLAYADALEALAAQLRKRAKHHNKDDDPFPVNPRPA